MPERGHELFRGFFGSVLFLQARARYRATRSAGCWCGFKKPLVTRQRFGSSRGGRKPVK